MEKASFSDLNARLEVLTEPVCICGSQESTEFVSSDRFCYPRFCFIKSTFIAQLYRTIIMDI